MLEELPQEDQTNLSFVQSMDSLRNRNRSTIDNIDTLKKDLEQIESLLDLQHQLWQLTFPFAILTHFVESTQPIILQTFYKNILTIYSSVKLTAGGLYGSGRALMRYTFEALMLGKFCALSHDQRVFNKWIKGDSIYFANMVLKKIESPDIEELTELWDILNDFAHFTTSSQQLEAEVNNFKDLKNIRLNFSLHKVLLACNYHLINAHFINTGSVRHFTKLYETHLEVKTLKQQIKESLKESNQSLSAKSKKIVFLYTRTWKIKQPILTNP